MEDRSEAKISPLSQDLSAGNKTVKIEICRGDAGGWNLEMKWTPNFGQVPKL